MEASERHRRGLAGLVCVLVLGIGLGPLLAQESSSRGAGGRGELSAAAQVRRRAEWFFRQRASAQGHVPGGLLRRAFAQNQAMIREDGTFLERAAAREAGISPVLSSWTSLGPQPTANTALYGNVSGRVTALAVDPCDTTGNTVYAGGADGGIWASFNALDGNSVTWQPLTDNQPSLATGALALAPFPCETFNGHMQSNLILAGTGESNYALDNIYGAGVLRSSDGGQTWTEDATFTSSASQGPGASGPYIAALAVQPHQTNPIVLAAVQGTDYSAGGTLLSGVWRSADGGGTWTRVQPRGGASGAPFNPATDVLFDPSDASGQTAYAALGDPKGDVDPQASCAAAPCNGVYISADAGMTWSRVTSVDGSSNPSLYGSVSLAIAPSDTPADATLYVAIADASTNSDNLLGILSGTGIQPNGTGPAFAAIYPNVSNLPDFCAPLCFYSMKLAVVPGTAGQVVFAGGSAQPPLGGQAYGSSSIYRSIDGGNSWSDMSADGSGNGTSTHVDVHALKFASSGGQVLAMFAGNDGGVWASEDVFNPATTSGAQHWSDLNTNTGNANTSLNLTQFYPGITIHPATDQIIYGGTQGNDVQQFSGSLAASETQACPYDGGYTAIDPQTPSTIYAACSYLGGIGTLNKNIMNGVPGTDGINWTAMDGSGINFSDNADFIPPLVLDAKNSQNLYFGTYRLYQTTNRGMSWSAISSNLTSDSSQNYITTIVVAPSDSNTIYAGTSDGLIWQTAQALSGAGDIHRINQSNQPGRSVAAIAVDAADPKAVFAAYSGFSCPEVSGCDGLGHVFFTKNSGASWALVDGNLPDVPVNDIVIDPTDATDNTIYVATDSGVYASANATAGGATKWSVLQTGLPNSQVLALKLRNTSRTLVAATHGRGLWSLLLPNLPSYALTELSPTAVNAGSGAFEVTATGNGFTPHSAIEFDGVAVTTSFVSTRSLTAMVPATAAACGGAVPVTVSDPTKGTTNALLFSLVGGACDFSFGTTVPASDTVEPGGTASYQLAVNAVGSAGGSVQLSCASPPAGFSCSFSPNPVTTAANRTAVALSVSVPETAGALAPGRSGLRSVRAGNAALGFMALIVILVWCGAMKWLDGSRAGMAAACVAVIALLGVMAACGGGGGGSGPSPQTYQITVQGVGGNFQHSTTVEVVVD
ncbi:MAG: sialidase family protein [Candidatus Acidiferrales bacterium]